MSMSIEISPQFEKRLRETRTVWLTTVRADGMPQPTPVWFLWQNGTILIYSQPDAQKIRNIAQNPLVAVNLNTDDWGNEYLVIMGEASIDKNQPPSNQVPEYIEKYREGIRDIKMTPGSVAESFSTAIRIKPLRVRGE
jgi:PPOX class probable F420-dependent enzyme